MQFGDYALEFPENYIQDVLFANANMYSIRFEKKLQTDNPI